MLESILFMLLIFTGLITLIISIIIIIVGIIKKKKQIKNIGFSIVIVPVFCFGLIAIFYGIILPNSYKNLQQDFAGTYVLNASSKTTLEENGLNKTNHQLILEANGSYIFDIIPGINLTNRGRWETGGIDGYFNFFDNYGNQVDFVFPSGGEKNCILLFDYLPNQKNLSNRKQLRFKKINQD